MKEKIIEILESYVSEIEADTYYANAIDESRIERVADEIVKLCNLHDVSNSVCDCEKCKPFINFAAGYRKNKTCIKPNQTEC